MSHIISNYQRSYTTKACRGWLTVYSVTSTNARGQILLLTGPTHLSDMLTLSILDLA